MLAFQLRPTTLESVIHPWSEFHPKLFVERPIEAEYLYDLERRFSIEIDFIEFLYYVIDERLKPTGIFVVEDVLRRE